MMISIAYILLALLGLGVLIFVHELGHYIAARRVGMRVESFGIGFGSPIYSFERKGVRWNICWLPFGGYVKIAGMEKDISGKEPSEIPDGFFGKTPWQRMLVSVAGPAANLLFAFVVFFGIWFTGGLERSFSEITRKIGWVDTQSELYRQGIRPGDEIFSYNGNLVRNMKDHLHAGLLGGSILKVDGKKWDATRNDYVPFNLTIAPYVYPHAVESEYRTTGIMAPANYIIYNKFLNGRENVLSAQSPLVNSGIQYGDRIVGLDGEKIFSLPELSFLLNDARTLVTVRRGDAFFVRRVPRVLVGDLKLSNEIRDELSDWQNEANLKDKKLMHLMFIPYNINSDCMVEGRLSAIDQEKEEKIFPKTLFSLKEEPLQVGDEIIAIDGTMVISAEQLLKAVQTKHVQLIVQQEPARLKGISYEEADQIFEQSVNDADFSELVQSIGTPQQLGSKGNLRLLKPIEPKRRMELDKGAQFAAEIEEEKKAVQAIDDVKKREQALKFLEQREKQLLLGLPGLSDEVVRYNPNPFTMFSEVVEEVVQTLSALVGGSLSPKWLSGPIGIVQVIHHQWMLGVKEALFWLGIISLNLGLLNLVPLPVLDGGYIALSIFEGLTGARLKAKTIERLVIPFAILLIVFFVFLTYHDLIKLFHQFFKF